MLVATSTSPQKELHPSSTLVKQHQAYHLWQQISSVHFCPRRWMRWGWLLLSLRVVSSHSDKQNTNLAQATLTRPFVFVLIVTGADIYPFFVNRVWLVYPTKKKKSISPAVNCWGETITAWKITDLKDERINYRCAGKLKRNDSLSMSTSDTHNNSSPCDKWQKDKKTKKKKNNSDHKLNKHIHKLTN